MPLNGILPITSNITPRISGIQSQQPKITDSASQISDSFSDYLNQLSETENQSDTLLQQLAAGEDVDLAQLMIATEETDVSFRVAVSIRDKLVEAYKEVMRMTV
jgi:flagellar hook-basal body complex protein FliE